MATINIFKKRKQEQEKKPAESEVEKSVKVKKEEPDKANLEVNPRPATERAEFYSVLKPFQATEKMTDLTKINQYVFKVSKKANKNEIKKAVETRHKVDVLSVKIINVPAKKRRLGKVKGWRPGYKKAIVRIKEGQKIEVLPR